MRARPVTPCTVSSEASRLAELPVPKPVIKWAGGKSRLVPQILGAMPEQFETYFEPFAGGAAVFFALATQGRFKRAVLADKNRELIDLYRALKKDVERVIAVLKHYSHSESEYYRIRALDPEQLDTFERAARTVYLNKTGYNGLYRVNRAGQFNVPFGRYKKPNFCDEPRLRVAASALKRVKLQVADFERCCEPAAKGDVVYFDPPYFPVSKTSSFTAYHREAFDEPEHERLARLCGVLARRGVTVILSNSDTERTRELFHSNTPKQIRIDVKMPRPINSRASARGEVSELLIVCNGRKRS